MKSKGVDGADTQSWHPGMWRPRASYSIGIWFYGHGVRREILLRELWKRHHTVVTGATCLKSVSGCSFHFRNVVKAAGKEECCCYINRLLPPPTFPH